VLKHGAEVLYPSPAAAKPQPGARYIRAMQRVLLIDDDARLAGMVRDYLHESGYAVATAHDAASGLAQLGAEPFDLVILDLMLPDVDGLEVCRRIRARHDAAAAVPIVMLTAKGDPLDRVIGLEIGADDYLPKPFEPRELLARVRAVLRRRGDGAAVVSADVLRFGRLEIDRGARQVRLGGERRGLTAVQFDLLCVLAERPGRVLSREQLMELARNDARGKYAFDPALDRSIDVHIARIRAAIEDDPKQPQRIITVRGAGYVFAKVQS
jgi:DNA-binding response OmpR family regulator